MFITPITGLLRRQPSKMSIRQTFALLAGLAALKALPAAGEEYRTLARLTDLFKRDPSRAAALVATAREGSRAINQSDAQRSPNLPGGSNLPALVDGVLVYDVQEPLLHKERHQATTWLGARQSKEGIHRGTFIIAFMSWPMFSEVILPEAFCARSFGTSS